MLTSYPNCYTCLTFKDEYMVTLLVTTMMNVRIRSEWMSFLFSIVLFPLRKIKNDWMSIKGSQGLRKIYIFLRNF